jgi:hypothetical protein
MKIEKSQNEYYGNSRTYKVYSLLIEDILEVCHTYQLNIHESWISHQSSKYKL